MRIIFVQNKASLNFLQYLNSDIVQNWKNPPCGFELLTDRLTDKYHYAEPPSRGSKAMFHSNQDALPLLLPSHKVSLLIISRQ